MTSTTTFLEMVSQRRPANANAMGIECSRKDLSIASVFREALDNLPMRREEAPIHVIELDKLEPLAAGVRLNSPFYISRQCR